MHFIRAFPIVLIIILILSCTFVFADSEWVVGSNPTLLSDNFINVYGVYQIRNLTDYPVWIYGVIAGSNTYIQNVVISNYPASVEIFNGSVTNTLYLNNTIVVDGTRYYVNYGTYNDPSLYLLNYMTSDSIQSSIASVFSSNYIPTSTFLYNITQLIKASNNWLSSIVGTVMANPLLIFILLFYFVGTAIGLLFRFRRN